MDVESSASGTGWRTGRLEAEEKWRATSWLALPTSAESGPFES